MILFGFPVLDPFCPNAEMPEALTPEIVEELLFRPGCHIALDDWN